MEQQLTGIFEELLEVDRVGVHDTPRHLARLEEADVHLDRGTYDLAQGYIEEQLGIELTRAFFGSESVLRRKAHADRQLQAALQVMRAAPTQDDVLTAAMKAQLSGKVR